MRGIKYRSFEAARKFVHSLKLKSMNEYRKYCKSGKKPEDIPSVPNTVYKDEEIGEHTFIRAIKK